VYILGVGYQKRSTVEIRFCWHCLFLFQQKTNNANINLELIVVRNGTRYWSLAYFSILRKVHSSFTDDQSQEECLEECEPPLNSHPLPHICWQVSLLIETTNGTDN
jgi:hypothetical protein